MPSLLPWLTELFSLEPLAYYALLFYPNMLTNKILFSFPVQQPEPSCLPESPEKLPKMKSPWGMVLCVRNGGSVSMLCLLPRTIFLRIFMSSLYLFSRVSAQILFLQESFSDFSIIKSQSLPSRNFPTHPPALLVFKLIISTLYNTFHWQPLSLDCKQVFSSNQHTPHATSQAHSEHHQRSNLKLWNVIFCNNAYQAFGKALDRKNTRMLSLHWKSVHPNGHQYSNRRAYIVACVGKGQLHRLAEIFKREW